MLGWLSNFVVLGCNDNKSILFYSISWMPAANQIQKKKKRKSRSRKCGWIVLFVVRYSKIKIHVCLSFGYGASKSKIEYF